QRNPDSRKPRVEDGWPYSQPLPARREKHTPAIGGYWKKRTGAILSRVSRAATSGTRLALDRMLCPVRNLRVPPCPGEWFRKKQSNSQFIPFLRINGPNSYKRRPNFASKRRSFFKR